MAITFEIVSVKDSDSGRLVEYKGFEDGVLKASGCLNFSRGSTPLNISKKIYDTVAQKIAELSATPIDMSELIGVELSEGDLASMLNQDSEG